jgi:hypothetical protein
MRSLPLALALSLAAACGGGAASRRCDESSEVRCLTGPECEWDDERGCEVCTCRSPEGATPVRDIMDPDHP